MMKSGRVGCQAGRSDAQSLCVCVQTALMWEVGGQEAVWAVANTHTHKHTNTHTHADTHTDTTTHTIKTQVHSKLSILT